MAITKEIAQKEMEASKATLRDALTNVELSETLDESLAFEQPEVAPVPYYGKPAEMPATTKLVNERELTHGDYKNTAKYIQQLKFMALAAMSERQARGQRPLTAMEQESLQMILHKIGRILSGDPGCQDHWDDIAGYAHIAHKE